MPLLFHTIAVEPARWIPQRTSQDLLTLLPAIADAGFDRVEVFEPHLTSAPGTPDIRDAFRSSHLSPEILSSYLKLNPAETSSELLVARLQEIRTRIDYYGFRAIRLFPGAGMQPSDKAAIAAFIGQLQQVVSALPDTEILLETHDGSFADDPEVIVRIVRDFNAPTVGLLFQPTFFRAADALRQFALQQPFIRHVHLQNRRPDGSFAPLSKGVTPWDRILPNLNPGVGATLEFVPVGICQPDQFDLSATLREAQSEAAYIREIWPGI